MVLTVDEVSRRYPIHWLVWNNQHDELKTNLENKKYTEEELELKDPRGRTPLLLAVTLGHTESAQALIDAGADVNCEKDGWTAVQEATSSGNAALLSLVLSRRDYQRHVLRSCGIPELLRKLSLAPDFYVEMKWEFTSWVPLVSRMCPFDTYKVYKRGANVRVDTTLIGFENNHWQRGDRTYIFRGQGRSASLVELDHEAGTAWCERVEPAAPGAECPAPSARALQQRLAAPISINYLDTDKISFERNKSGIWGWRQDKTEPVNGYECKVFSANNVELVSKTRTEHLDKARRSSPRAPLAGLLALADSDTSAPSTPLLTPETEEPPRSRSREELNVVSWEEYFSGEAMERDIGRPKEITEKVQKFKATLWLCEDYPLELQEQIMPILDLMAAISSPHFAKLKDFIQMQLPAGFPVKIEIPLFHVLNARITFGNIFGTESGAAHVQCIAEGRRAACVLDDACFELGRGYRDAAAPEPRGEMDHDERLMHYAIQQSLMDAGTHDDQVDVWEALRGARPPSPLHETQLQRAIEASLATMTMSPPTPPPMDSDPELQEALALSAKEQATRAQQLEAEQRALDEVLRLSLIDK
ncbi:ankyrin repeat domain-containing protein 13D isoform X1 [Bombyx mandarina]|uniref:Ankyrin repeat domain-containing protein 13D isoform X1 n=1 Tax=Bombyx mandarina TaxID=7092 RepID=A0A6J2JWZ8_BOMMA|nr:ankyrin repeat domain-containing protein 13D isoform X1 [Bombyx mandarina]